MTHRLNGACHCGAIGLELTLPRPPEEEVVGACQCSFCRKHSARTVSDPKAQARLVLREPIELQRYRFGLSASEVVLCRRCGVYVAMLMTEAGKAWSTINIDALDERARFTRPAEPRDFSGETLEGRRERRIARWTPTELVGWPKE
ncbi:aldehyde-activating protein [Bosea sp. FBZP-16]|uniref:GFA family protein n=1 Tax=Bosea sp. FBZP-16 TaxID=2065382 RepID=UPI000C2FF526|nr:aldehyde-activating protein [Bosea sp. FBZP-16]